MDLNSGIIFLACLIIIILLGKVFYVPLKHIIKLIINSLLGGLLIYIVNIIGESFCFHIGLNLYTAGFIGIFGIPGAIVLILIKLII